MTSARNTTEMAAATLMVGLPGPHLDQDTERHLNALKPGGIILFGRNLESAEQTANLIAALGRLPTPPRLLAIDQEGGAVSRLEPWIGATPSAAALAQRGPADVSRFAALTGGVVRALGFNLDFAPVVDLCPGDATNGIGDRSFGEDPAQVINLAGHYLDALQGAGVAGCLKHFPGLGCTSVDSHVQLPTAARSMAELEENELRPFQELGKRSACVMIGHGHYPAWNPGGARPATGSATIIRGVLRERLGYRGLVVSDDLLMGAVADLDADGHFGVESLAAGCDLLLYCTELDRASRAAEAIASEARGNRFLQGRLLQAHAAIEAVAKSYPLRPPSLEAWEQAKNAITTFSESLR